MENTIYISGANLIICSILVLVLGDFLIKRISVLSRFNIPVAVVGGICCSIFILALNQLAQINVTFDMSLRDTLLLTFFSTIGLSAKMRSLAAGGKNLGILLFFAILLLFSQDIAGIAIAIIAGVEPAYGLFAGSISFAGGHGTAIAWGQTAEQAGLTGASTLGIACATFGLVAGGIIGAPVGGYLINKHKLANPHDHKQEYQTTESVIKDDNLPLEGAFTTLLLLALCVAFGGNINTWLKGTGVSLPPFLTAMFVGILLTNLADVFKAQIHETSINRAGEISLHLFLAMSLMAMPLLQLADAIGILLIILIVQMLVISLIGVFLVFRFTGKDYDASVMASGFLGLGLGATPVAMANMQAMTSRYGPSPKAFIVVPLVGAFFIDLSNAIVIQIFSSKPLLHGLLN